MPSKKLNGWADTMGLLNLLQLPNHQGMDTLDDAAATLHHAEILQQKKFLKNLYIDFYRRLQTEVGETNNKKIIELGSGAGFIKEIMPAVTTSDILDIPTVDTIFSATDMPFEANSIDAVVMIDVLHHIPDVRAFFREASRCLRSPGRIVMIEPANTLWGRFIYRNFHHEAFEPKAQWEFESKGPLSTANGAIPWIVFHRDRIQFEQEFPQLKIIQTRFHTPLRYLLSGGFTLRQLTPSCCYGIVKGLENLISPMNRWIGMFETIVLEKNGD